MHAVLCRPRQQWSGEGEGRLYRILSRPEIISIGFALKLVLKTTYARRRCVPQCGGGECAHAVYIHYIGTRTAVDRECSWELESICHLAFSDLT